jgi:hypothetical protein
MTRLAFWTVAAWTFVSSAAADDRLAEVERLVGDYAAEEEKFFGVPVPGETTAAHKIERYESWPGWKYIPKFLALAEAQPDDEAAFRSCQWIFERTWNVRKKIAQLLEKYACYNRTDSRCSPTLPTLALSALNLVLV